MNVPLWMGLLLKKSRSCRFQPPDWLNPEALAEYLQVERTEPGLLQLPFHYIEIGNLLLTRSAEGLWLVNADGECGSAQSQRFIEWPWCLTTIGS